jgi:hypothetical protein
MGPAAKLAIQEVVKHMLAPSMSFHGLHGLRNFFRSINDWNRNYENDKDKTLLYLRSLHGFIEEYGTGGALFRNLYYNFLRELVGINEVMEGERAWTDEDIGLIELGLPTLQKAAKTWTDFAGKIKGIVEAEGERLPSSLALEELQQMGDEIVELETMFWNRLKHVKP